MDDATAPAPEDVEATLYWPLIRTQAGRHRVLTVAFWNLVAGCGPTLALLVEAGVLGWILAAVWATLWWFFIAREQSDAAAAVLAAGGRPWRRLTPGDYAQMVAGAIALQITAGVLLGVVSAVFTAVTGLGPAVVPMVLAPLFLVIVAMLIAYWGRALASFGLAEPEPVGPAIGYGIGSALTPVSRELAHVLVAGSVWAAILGLVELDGDAWPLAAAGGLLVLSTFQVALGRLGALAHQARPADPDDAHGDDLDLPSPESA